MRVYFAHQISDYDTPIEKALLEYLTKAYPSSEGYEIVNPNRPEHAEWYKLRGMAYFEDLVRTCQVLVAFPFRDGEWGMGVWREAETMAHASGMVYLIRGRKLGTFRMHRVDYREIRPLSIMATRRRTAALLAGKKVK